MELVLKFKQNINGPRKDIFSYALPHASDIDTLEAGIETSSRPA